MVYVISIEGKPLMPCSPVIARLLLKQDKAKCIKRSPFTIKLLYETTAYTQELTLGVDTGSSKIGSAVVNDSDKVRYLGDEYFIKGRMSTGYAILMDVEGNKIDFSDAPKGMKTPKMANMTRISGRKSWIVQAKSIRNIS